MVFRKVESETHGDITTNLYFNDDGDMVEERQQDIEPILKSNHERGSINNGYTQDRSMQEVADIPMNVWSMWRKEFAAKGININKKEAWPHIIAKLNDIDNQKLRVGTGNLGKGKR